MDKPSKCKNCQWYGKPYWSIINPCDNCPNEEINTIITINNNGNDLTISKDNISTSTGKIVLNNVEIIDTGTFYKAVKTFNELEKEIKNKDKEIARLNKIIERLVNYNELVYKRYDRKIKDHTIRGIVKHNLEIIKELKEKGKNE